MRLSVSLLALLIASPALAEEVTLRADITDATVFQSGAELTRSASVTLTAGTHRVYLTMPDLAWVRMPVISVDGADVIGRPQPASDMPVAEGALDTAAQAAARANVEAAEDALDEVQSRIAQSEAAIQAGELQLAYLTAISRGGEDGVAMPADAATLTQLLTTLGAEMARVSEELRLAREAREPLLEELNTRQADLDDADAAFERLAPFLDRTDMIAVDLDVPSDGPVTLEASYLTGGASWAPRYQMNLASETGDLELERSISLSVDQPDLWRDVTVVFSTADPNRARAPQSVFPTPARIFDPEEGMPEPVLAPRAPVASLEQAAPMMMDGRADRPAVMVTQGLSVSYDYAAPVSVGPSGTAELPLDTLAFTAELTHLAVPRRDTTAFLMAEFENTSGEPILPGETRFYRDGAALGEGFLDLLTPNAELDLPFGPLDHLRLEWQDLSLDEGDRGVFVQSNTQERRVRFTVENTSDTAEAVRVLYATPFAEQEDLDIDLTLTPAPTTEDYDDLRGVMAWDVTVAPGDTQEIEMSVELNWPDGQILSWRP